MTEGICLCEVTPCNLVDNISPCRTNVMSPPPAVMEAAGFCEI